jgi:hypothetical protein
MDPVDDWLGDVSDDDWNAPDGSPGGSRSPASWSPADESWDADPAERPEPDAAGPGRDVVDFGRRRAVAALVVLLLLGVAAAFAVVLLRGDDGGQTTAVTEPLPTTTSPSETETSPTATEPTTTGPTTTEPATEGTDAFTLPAGTKLQAGAENDPAVVTDLQEALTAAGFDPGAADGTYGAQTEAAVVAFQEANDLAVDGRVGPETAAALNAALADG